MNQQRKRSRIILIGDSCKDVSHFGHVNRLSPEGPFPVLDYHSTEVADGMIMNVYNNFMNLLMRPDDITLYSKLCEEKIRYFDDVSQRQLMRMDKPILDDIQAYHNMIFAKDDKERAEMYEDMNKYKIKTPQRIVPQGLTMQKVDDKQGIATISNDLSQVAENQQSKGGKKKNKKTKRKNKKRPKTIKRKCK